MPITIAYRHEKRIHKRIDSLKSNFTILNLTFSFENIPFYFQSLHTGNETKELGICVSRLTMDSFYFLFDPILVIQVYGMRRKVLLINFN